VGIVLYIHGFDQTLLTTYALTYCENKKKFYESDNNTKERYPVTLITPQTTASN